MNLRDLFVVVDLQRHEIRLHEGALFLVEQNRHGGPEHREAFVEADDFLLVQPQQRAVEQLGWFLDLCPEHQVGLHRR